LELPGVCVAVTTGVSASTGSLDGSDVLDGSCVLEDTGVFDGTGVIEGGGVVVGTGVIDGAGVIVGTGVNVGTGVFEGTGVAVGTGVTVDDAAQLGTLIFVLAALAVTAVFAKILPFVTEFAPSVTADPLITVPTRVLSAPIVATLGTQNILQGLAPLVNCITVFAAVVKAPSI
jgi:hypothetical protein